MDNAGEFPDLKPNTSAYIWGAIGFVLIIAAASTVILAPIALLKYIIS